MENQANSKGIIINYGLMLAGVSILTGLGTYAAGQHFNPHWSLTVITSLTTVALVVLAIKKFKDTNNGFMSWSQAVKVGVGVSIVSALVGAIYTYIFMNFIEPDFLNQVMEIQNQKFLDDGMSEEQIEATNEMTAAFRNPTLIAAMSIIGSAVGGFIISAIAGAIMKKDENDHY